MPPAEPNWTHLQIPPIVPGSLSASPPRVGAVSDRSPTSVQLTDRSLRFDHREARCAEGHCDSPLLRNEVEETPGGGRRCRGRHVDENETPMGGLPHTYQNVKGPAAWGGKSFPNAIPY